MNFRTFVPILWLIYQALIPASLAWAQNKPGEQIPRLLNLKKLTIGPGDNFQGIMTADSGKFIFTHIVGQSQALYQQSVGSFGSQAFLDSNEDATNPALSLDGKLVAYTSYKKNSRGDICYSDLMGKVIDCLAQSQSADSEPFWLSSGKIGFVSRDFSSNLSRLMAWDISSKKTEVVHSESIWSPQFSPALNQLVYVSGSKHNKHGKSLFIKDLNKKTSFELLIDLPGISSSPQFSDDGYIYFTQYINDTNQDHILDGNDNGVIFRLKNQEARAEHLVFPEQLTSVANNCSYPKPTKDQLILSCAFEGTLDLYAIPLTGIIPSSWSEALLLDAHMTARSYADRVLILNNLRFRYPQKYKNNDIITQIFSNHFLLREWDAARYYGENLQQSATSIQAKSYYALINTWIDLEQETERLPSRQVTAEYTRNLKKWQSAIEKHKAVPHLRALVLLNTYISSHNENLAKKSFTQLLPQSFTYDIEYYFYNFLAERLFDPSRDYASLKEVLTITINKVSKNPVSQAFYSMKLLKLIASKPLAQRTQEINESLRKFPEESLPHKLFLAEKYTLDMIAAPDEKGRLAAYKPLDKLMSANRDDYHLNKNIYIRAINNLASNLLVTELDYIASTWLRYTKNDSTEAAYAREQYILANLDQAYEKMATGRPVPATGHFWGVVMATDDLEGHFGYISATELAKKSELADSSYAKVVNKRVSAAAYNYVQAVTKILRTPVLTVDTIDEALKLVETDVADFDNPAMKYLFIGYLYLEKTLLSSKGFSFDQDAQQKAHHYLLLAYDSGFLNKRVAASALMNLGLLHMTARNYSLAAKFLSARESLGFANDNEAKDYYWFLSKSLFYNRSYLEAADALKRGLDTSKDVHFTLAARERRALYLGLAGKNQEAIKDYQALYPQLGQYTAATQAKIMLNYGYNLLLSKDLPKAQAQLQDSLKRIRKLDAQKESDTKLVRFEPLRIEATALGLLAKASASDRDKEAHLRARLGVLETMTKDPSRYYQKKDDLLRLQIKLALQLTNLKQSPAANWPLVFTKLNLFLDEGGNILDQSIFNSLKNFYLWSGANPTANIDKTTFANADEILQKIAIAFKDIKENQYFLFLSRYKIHAYKVMSEVSMKKRAAQEGSANIKKLFEENQGPKLNEMFKGEMDDINLILTKHGVG